MFVAALDPVAMGVVASLARPGGNVTGMSAVHADLTGKRLQLLRELLPQLSGIAFLVRATSPATAQYVKEAELAARTLGVQLRVLAVRDSSDFEGAFSEARDANALLVVDDAVMTAHRTLFPEVAKQRGVQAVLTLVLVGQFRWTGAIALEEVIPLVTTRDPASMGPAALERMLKDGAARRLARMMADRNLVFPALIELLCHDQWPVRLGAMVAVEEVSVMAPDLGRQAIAAVWERFAGATDAVKGDFLFLCGEIGEPSLVPRIEAVLQRGASADVAAAAEEALAKRAAEPRAGIERQAGSPARSDGFSPRSPTHPKEPKKSPGPWAGAWF